MADSNVRELFLRGVWKGVLPRDDAAWVERVGELGGNDGPIGDYGPLVRSMLDSGVSATDIARLAQIVAYEAVFGLLYHLDDPSASYDGFPPEPVERAWSLVEIDPETDTPVQPMRSLYEDLLASDPSGQEMRPRPSP